MLRRYTIFTILTIMKTTMNNVNDTAHKKRFGQFFSGKKVADLLALLLPGNHGYESIVDPMAGKGDLLDAIRSKAATDAHILGVEIDAPVASVCRRRLPDAEVENADAFQSDKLISREGWDLVITNPPYVRYQLQRSNDGTMPSANSVRTNLISQLERLPYLADREKELFLRIARNYSGLSDMAVPSWILCASLVKLGGILAIVVPETWLSRDYAAPIQYLLMKAFDVLTIVRDVNACWFDDASVRTCLVVARRKKVGSLYGSSKAKTLVIDLKAELAGENSLIDHLAWNGLSKGKAFTDLLSKGNDTTGDGFSMQGRLTTSLFPHFASSGRQPKWIQHEDMRLVQKQFRLPPELQDVIKPCPVDEFISLNDLGISCGQGLRTGANEFFYFKILDETSDAYLLRTSEWFKSGKTITLPKDLIVRCLQRRSKVNGVVADSFSLDTGLLYLQDSVRSRDLALCSPGVARRYKVMPEALDEYITAADEHVNTRGLTFSEYSAVKTNVSRDRYGFERFWYMLPSLTSRHTPNLCISRVGSNAADCVYVPQLDTRKVAVDANFVTLWCRSEHMAKAGLALLNSTWSRCSLELLCTVMGGGALKIEASHIGKLLFPPLSPIQLQELTKFGVRIVTENRVTPSLRDSIDGVILRYIDAEKSLSSVKALLKRKLEERGAEYEL